MKTFFKTYKLENWTVVSRRKQYPNQSFFKRPFYFRFFESGMVKYVEAGLPGI